MSKNCRRDCTETECKQLHTDGNLCDPAAKDTYVCLEDKEYGKGKEGMYGGCMPEDKLDIVGGWQHEDNCAKCCNTAGCIKGPKRNCKKTCTDDVCAKFSNPETGVTLCSLGSQYMCSEGSRDVVGGCSRVATGPGSWQVELQCEDCCDMSTCGGFPKGAYTVGVL